MADSKPRWKTIRKVYEDNPGLFDSISSVRWMVYRAEDYGLGDAVSRLGKKRLVDETRLLELVNRNANAA